MVLSERALGLSALSPCRLGSRLLGKRASWLGPSVGALALIRTWLNFAAFTRGGSNALKLIYFAVR